MSKELRYAAYIDRLISNWSDPNRPYESMEPLFKAFGCHFTEQDGSRGWIISTPHPTDTDVEGIVRQALKSILTVRSRNDWVDESDSMALFDVLGINDRWRECLLEVDTAHCLVAMLVEFAAIENPARAYHAINLELAQIVAPLVLKILNDWLSPAKPYEKLPPPSELARLFFGDFWPEFALDPDVLSTDFRALPKSIRTMCPPFIPGLLPAHLEPIATDLPSIHFS
jgi:hypothetical protein